MLFLFRFLSILCLISTVGHGQAVTQQLTNSETTYYLGMLHRLADPQRTDQLRDRQLAHLRGVLALSPEETQIVRAAVQRFNSMLISLTTAERALVAGKPERTDFDRLQLARLVEQRDSAVREILPALLANLRPETAALLRKYAKEHEDLVTRKEVN